jgi:hypothetical protein
MFVEAVVISSSEVGKARAGSASKLAAKSSWISARARGRFGL